MGRRAFLAGGVAPLPRGASLTRRSTQTSHLGAGGPRAHRRRKQGCLREADLPARSH